jgi:hypothetical protein
VGKAESELLVALLVELSRLCASQETQPVIRAAAFHGHVAWKAIVPAAVHEKSPGLRRGFRSCLTVNRLP